MAQVEMKWLKQRSQKKLPVTFGTPWARGELHRETKLSLVGADGKPVASQVKNTAYWPDGSVKWTAHSAVLNSDQNYQVVTGEGPAPQGPVTAWEDGDGVTVQSGLLCCRIQKGELLLSSLNRKGFAPVSGKLVALLENKELHEDYELSTVHRFEGVTEKITLEESGPVRVVVKVEGVHKAVHPSDKERTVFPFSLRLYFYADSDEIKIVHSFTFDIDEKQDFLKGLALELHMEASGELYNRHVGFVCESGMFYEAVQPAYYGLGWTYPGKPVPENVSLYQRQQQDGQFIEIPADMPEFAKVVADNADWNNFRLNQPSCDHYEISKRTEEGCAYITAFQGNRSQGTIFFGNPSGMIAASIKDFWQKAPMALEIQNAAGQHPVMTLWLWSRYAEPMDFRAYDTHSHTYSYGGIDNHPEGIANTNEIYLKLFDQMPGKQAVMDFASDVQSETLLIAPLERYADTKVFGSYWSCKDPKYQIPGYENALYNIQKFYVDEVKRRRWYGFWDYGDVMHTYDPVRHCWRYDVGGFAWHNTELCNTYVNWLVFLRTGDYDIYRFARAMSRHCSEVDVYHAGTYAMLGSRHNVRHWGCGAKEARISMAGHYRFFYYLTADERIGDVMDFVKDSDFTTLVRDPMGSYFPPHPKFSHCRTGPDWTSFLSNWMTAWERTEDPKYRDKLLGSIESIKKAPLGLSSGSTFHYDPETGLMHYMGAENPAGHTHLGDGNYQQHMVVMFGGAEIWFELCELLEDEKFREMVADFGEYYGMTPEERNRKSHGLFNAENDRCWGGNGGRMTAYAGYYFDSDRYMEEGLESIDLKAPLTAEAVAEDGEMKIHPVPQKDFPYPMEEVVGMTTNTSAQWSLGYMEVSHLMEQRGKK